MKPLRQTWQWVARLAARRPYLSIASAAVLLVGGGGMYAWHDAAQARHSKQSALARLEADRKALQREQHTQPDHADTLSEAAFRDISDTPFRAPDCSRLQNRRAIVITSADCRYTVKAFGDISMAVVFITTNAGATDSEYVRSNLVDPDAGNPRSLARVNAYLAAQAARHKIADPPKLSYTFFGPYTTDDAVLTYNYREKGGAILEQFEKTATANKVPFDKYDLVHYVYLRGGYGGVASPGLHRAFTYNFDTATFTHETLHLFGATDKYHGNDCATIGTSDPFGRGNGGGGSDIMCTNASLDYNFINDITAREIGWQN